MTTYYVSPNGSDANNGLGPDASHGSNKPWLTIAKALGAAGIASGDTVYIAPGTYRETVTVAMTSAVAETSVIGDPANSQGFRDGSGVLRAAGDVVWSAFTTSDIVAAAAAACVDLSTRDYLTLQYLTFICGNASTSGITSASGATNITVKDCVFVGHYNQGGIITMTAPANTAINWTIDRCVFLGMKPGTTAGVIAAVLTRHTADYDAVITVRNSLFINGNVGVRVSSTGAGTGKGGGVDVLNCTMLGVRTGVVTADANLSTTHPCTVLNSVIHGGDVGLNANTSGQITEDYNVLNAPTLRTNVSAGANSKDNLYAPTIEIGQSYIAGRTPRPFATPTTGSPLLGFGGSSPPSVDLLNNPRPAGGASASKAVGALERGNTFTQETSTVRTGSNALVITGPGYQDFPIRVDAASTTVSVYVRWDSTYAGTKPIMQVLNGGECGVADATDTATGSADTWEQLSLNFTAARQGVVTVRFLSSDTNGGGKMFVDDASVV